MNNNSSAKIKDDVEFFDELAKTYVKHKAGLFILAPSGTGKSYFTSRQDKKDWIDGDILWPLAGADTTSDEWIDDLSTVMETNNKCDVVTEKAKKLGFWVIGASNSWLKPDAIVLPEWDTHLSYIKKRQADIENFDGGATLANIDGLKSHIRWISDKWPMKEVQYFTSIEEAVKFLVK
jgi:hypothetical protein